MCLTAIAHADIEASTQTLKTVEELQKAIKAILDNNHVPGAGIALVAKDHIIWAGGVGKADLAGNKDVTADTVFRVGSISKSFVAAALLKLQEEARLTVDAPAKEIVPEIEIRNPWEQTHPVRLANLLEHTAGFDDMHPNEVYNVQDPPDISLREVFRRFPKPQEVRWPPSTRMAYSNPGYGLAGYVIEKVTGRPFEDYIQDAILTPLGMTHASFRLTEANRALLAQGYDGNPPHAVPYMNIYLRPAGDLKSSPAEMARFVQMMLNRGSLGELQLLKPESVRRMETPRTTLAARAELKNGYGLGDYATLDHPIKEYGHDGGISGFISTYRYMPEEGLGYVVLLNSTVSGEALRKINDLVFDYLTSGLPRPKQPAIKLTPNQLEDFVGYYQPANPRNQLLAFVGLLLGGDRVFLDHGVLYRKGFPRGKREALIPVSANEFRLEKQPEASMVFCNAEDGTRLLTGGGLYEERFSPTWPVLRLMLIITCLVLMLSSSLFALTWIPRKVLGRMKDVPHLHVRALPLLAVLALAAAVVFFFRLMGGPNPGARNLDSEAFCAATWLFALLSLGSLLAALRSFRLEIRPGVRAHSLLVSLACCGIAGYLAYWGLLGLRMWAY
jgi:CubicO group peptidase (beta-lactamase class C family)